MITSVPALQTIPGIVSFCIFTMKLYEALLEEKYHKDLL